MKVIDLLNKMANYEKMPEFIKVSGEIYEYYPSYKDYLKEDSSKWFITDFVDNYADLNKEVEIIEDTIKEDKKIKKIKPIERKPRNIDNVFLKDKINEIIDKINGE